MLKAKFGDKLFQFKYDEPATALFISDAGTNDEAKETINVIHTGESGKTIGQPVIELAEDWRRWPTNYSVQYDLEHGLDKINDGRVQVAEAWKELLPVIEPDPEPVTETVTMEAVDA